MLANTYTELDTTKITVTKPAHAEYCALEAANFLEPKGMHIFSIHNLPLYKNSTPIFKTTPLTAYLIGTAIDKTTNKISTDANILSSAQDRLRFVPGNRLAEYDASIELTDLQTKMHKTFASLDEAGIVAFRPKINAGYYYGFRLNNNKIKIAGKEKLVVKLIAKIPQGLSLKASCICDEPLAYLPPHSIIKLNARGLEVKAKKIKSPAGTMSKGFLLKDNTHSTEAKGTNKWEVYTFIIDNKYQAEGYLESLVFYVGRTNSDSETDIIDTSLSQYDNYVYLCYADFLVLPKDYNQLDQYNPLENVTRIKSGNLENSEFFEENRLIESIDPETKFKHDIILKKKAAEPVMK